MRLFIAHLLVAALPLAPVAYGQDSALPAMDALRSLVGDWTGEGPAGEQIQVTYEIVSGGHAVVETRRPDGQASMVTLFSMDGPSVLAVHYCSAGNQPRLRSPGEEDGRIRFGFVDASNLADDDEGHMRGLILEAVNADELTQVWTWREAGQEKDVRFTLKRSRDSG